MNRTILHLRVDGLAVAVERLRDPSLRDRPVVVCARHSPRSPIFSASPEARAEGVYEGLPLTRALRRCRSLVVVPPDGRLYARAVEEIGRVLGSYSPLVEYGKPGQFYVDLTGTERLFGCVQDSAFRIQREVRNRLGFSGTLGIGSNKLVSGVAAVVIESYGDLYAVPEGSEASFLAPLRVQMLPAVQHRRDRLLLSELNIRFVHHLARISVPQLTRVFGRRGIVLHRQAMGIDEAPVVPRGSRPFILEEETLEQDTNDDHTLLGILCRMVERACSRMRKRGVIPRTIWLHLRYTDGVDLTRCLRGGRIEPIDPLIFPVIEKLYFQTCTRRARIRYMSLTFTDLSIPTGQMNLFSKSSFNQRERMLVSALDRIRERFGEAAVRWGRVAN